MCNVSGVVFAAKHLERHEVRGRRVLEVGAYDVNGSLRPVLEAWGAAEYVGVDLHAGPGVDVVLPAEQLVERFGTERFDVVVSTEMIEHVRDWRAVLSNMKRVLAPGGLLVLTTRSPGYPYHGWPGDFWRYTAEDMRTILADCEIVALEDDPLSPGIFAVARKPVDFQERDLAAIALTNVLTGRRALAIADADARTVRAWRMAAKDRLKGALLDAGRRFFKKA